MWTTAPDLTFNFEASEFLPGQPNGKTFTVLAVADTRFIFQQSVAAAEWTVEHNLSLFPVVHVVRGVNPVLGKVTHVDANTLTIEFQTPLTGEAHLGV